MQCSHAAENHLYSKKSSCQSEIVGRLLAIPDLFAFDDDWNNWLSTYRDLSADKPISLF